MKMKILVMLLILCRDLFAQQSTTRLVLPWGLGSLPSWSGENLSTNLRCGRITSVMGITSASHIGFFRNTNMAGGGKCGAAIYPDSDSGTALITTGGVACDGGDNPWVSISPTVTLSAKNVYRVCVCATAASGSYVSTGIGANPRDLINAFGISTGTGANSCNGTTGAPPTTTGALTAASIDPPVVILWAE